MISIIVAASENNVIGNGNKIPWRMPRDQKYFAAVTRGHTVIMGRNTYESIMGSLGKPLPDRVNIVVTRNLDFKAAGCTVVHSLEEALKISPKNEEAFVIGGSQLYAEALPKANKIYRTLIHTTLDGDAFFPTLPTSDWQLETSKLEPKDDKNPFDATYEVYTRKG
ncbi:MAG: dihydrofolate reductase [bacterium]|nr:dihydrofolate reductase [bacterium]